MAETLLRWSTVPATLKHLPRWCRWQFATSPSGKPTKQPIGSTRDPRTKQAFVDVQPHERIGFIMTGGVQTTAGHLYAFDLDGCRDPKTGAIAEWAQEILRAHALSYAEVTPSGTGLRQWVIARRKMTAARSKVRVPHDAMPNVPPTKAVELQVFGSGAASYVTVSGQHVPGTTPDVATVESLDWLVERFGLGREDEAERALTLPSGDGPAPSLDAVEAALRAEPQGAAMIAGHWESVLAGRSGSASEVFAAMTVALLRITRGHGATVVDFVLQRTAWGRGEIENSADAGRYARREWVGRDVARTARKMPPPPAPDAVFDVEPVPAADAVAPSPADAGSSAPVEAGADGAQGKRDPEDVTMSSAEMLQCVEREPCLVYDLLPRVGLAQVFGEPGCGKTPVVLSLAVHVAAGLKTWFGRDVDRHGSVLYLVGEARGSVAARFQAECERLGVDGESLPIRFSRRPARLTDATDAALFVRNMRATDTGTDGVALVVIDTQSRNFGPANENETADMQRFIDCCDAIARLLGCCVVSVHHTGHGDKERARGASVLFGALDSCLQVYKAGMAVRVVSRKGKDWEDPEPMLGQLVVHTLGTDAKGRPRTAVTLDAMAPVPFETVIGAEVLNFLALVRESEGRLLPYAEIAARLGIPAKGTRLRSILNRAEVDLKLVEKSFRITADGRGYAYSITGAGLRAITQDDIRGVDTSNRPLSEPGNNSLDRGPSTPPDTLWS